MGTGTSFLYDEKDLGSEKVSILSRSRTRTFSFPLPGGKNVFTVPDGWRFSVLACAFATAWSFLINFLITIITVAKFGVQTNGNQVLYSGDCDTVQRLNTIIHFFINVMSTILLGSSNYTMQCLSAATREEIDVAHQAKNGPKSIDIGRTSIRNLTNIKKERVWLWTVLAASSIPLHLFYNSAVFSSIATYSYPIVASNAAFVTSDTDSAEVTDFSFAHEDLGLTWLDDSNNGTIVNGTATAEPALGLEYAISAPWRLRTKALAGNLTNLTQAQCIDAYARNFVTNRGAVILVLDTTNQTNATQPKIYQEDFSDSHDNSCEADRFAWMCDQDGKNTCQPTFGADGRTDAPCSSRIDSTTVRLNDTGWKPLRVPYPVQGCLSEELPQQCRLLASFPIVLMVLVLNLAKSVVMCRVAIFLKERPILTIGDAIASFLERPDLTTKGMCLLSQKDLNKEVFQTLYRSGKPKQYKGSRPRWLENVTRTKFVLFWIIFVLCLIGVGFSLLVGIENISSNGSPTNGGTLWSIGFGSADPRTIISWSLPQTGTAAIFSNSFVANSPQIALSAFYFGYNSIFTAMFTGAEWQGYMETRKGLRVSEIPRGAQRTTYFLQLPYRAALPLMVASGLIHWLIGQSIFLVDIEAYSWVDSTGLYSPQAAGGGRSTITCGYSPMPMILALVVGVLMVLPLIWFARKRYATSMPVVASNSFAIAAACHPSATEEGQDGAAFKQVQWGVVEQIDHGIGHMAFSSEAVEKPEIGGLYA